MEPDTLKKQTCYRESVYILLLPLLSLPLSSLHCLGWQFLDCFTSRFLWPMVVKGKPKTHNLFLLTVIHCRFVSGCPFGQYCLDALLKCESGGQEGNRTRQGMNFKPTRRNYQNDLPRLLWSRTKSSRTHLARKLSHSHRDKSKRFWHTKNKAGFQVSKTAIINLTLTVATQAWSPARQYRLDVPIRGHHLLFAVATDVMKGASVQHSVTLSSQRVALSRWACFCLRKGQQKQILWRNFSSFFFFFGSLSFCALT